MARVCELCMEGVLCASGENALGHADAIIVWDHLRATLKFPSSDEANFLSSAHQNLCFFVLIDYLVQRKALGELWAKPEPKADDDPANRARANTKTSLTPARALQAARMVAQWCRFPLPQPPHPQALVDKLTLQWSVSMLLAVQGVMMVMIESAARSSTNDTTRAMIESSTDVCRQLSVVFLTHCQQGEKGGFFQKLTTKATFSIESCLLLRLYGTLLGTIVNFLSDLSGATPTPAQQKERTAWIEKLQEFKKLKAYAPYYDVIDWMLGVLPHVNASRPLDMMLTSQECVKKCVMKLFPTTSVCAPLLDFKHP